jgi:hypothetical protein
MLAYSGQFSMSSRKIRGPLISSTTSTYAEATVEKIGTYETAKHQALALCATRIQIIDSAHERWMTHTLYLWPPTPILPRYTRDERHVQSGEIVQGEERSDWERGVVRGEVGGDVQCSESGSNALGKEKICKGGGESVLKFGIWWRRDGGRYA